MSKGHNRELGPSRQISSIDLRLGYLADRTLGLLAGTTKQSDAVHLPNLSKFSQMHDASLIAGFL